MANIILPVAQPWGGGPPRSGGGGAATSRHRPSVSASRCHLPIASRQGGSGSAPVQPALAKRLAMKKLALSMAAIDRKSIGSGKRVSVRVDIGGRLIIKKKKKNNKN